jgi:DNA-directed RNA polymerase subunit N (RpoN/RPB10)
MIIPVRCFTCGKLLNKYKKYCELREQGMPIKQIFKELRLKRYCCRKNMLTHVDIVEKLN